MDERARKRLHDALERLLGSDEAATMMEHLPPVGWADVATRRDVEQLRVATKRDLQELRVGTKRDLQELRVATTRDFQELRVATTRDLDALRLEVQAQMERLARRVVMWTSSMVVAMTGLSFAAARLL
ncbi:MAG TPA: hypothetical protein VF058_04695 [Actinomycetota bacterium]